MMNSNSLTLEQYRKEFSQRRFLAIPLAGTLCWGFILESRWRKMRAEQGYLIPH